MMRVWSHSEGTQQIRTPQRSLVNVAFNGAGARYHAFFGAAAAVADYEKTEVARVFGMSSGFLAAMVLACGFDGDLIHDTSNDLDMRKILQQEKLLQRLMSGGLQSTRAIGWAIDKKMEELGVSTFGELPPPPKVVRELLPHDAPWRLSTRAWVVANGPVNRTLLGIPRSLDLAIANLLATDIRSKDGRARESALMAGAYAMPLPQALIPMYMKHGESEQWARERIDNMSFSEIAALTMAPPILFPNGMLHDLPEYRWFDGAIHERHLSDVWADGRRLSDADGENWYFRLAGNYPDRLPAVVFGIEQRNRAGLSRHELHGTRLVRNATYSIDLDSCGVRFGDFRDGAARADELFETSYKTTMLRLESDSFAEYCASQTQRFEKDLAKAFSVTKQVDDIHTHRPHRWLSRHSN